ncbi:hypothetical protein [Rhodococcus qingshengii]|uniref:ApeA N-terminal domain 1-containing protein n=1 Tax=Rhodococcus qingshengii TaxID=334542 RepID=UPI001ABF252A|nr:hypothetical protein [Rhodococcus qingshengii]
MGEQRFVGKWWLPSDVNKVIGGVLTIDVEGNSELELNDALIDDADFVPMVHGIAQGRDMTLLDVMSIGTRTVSAQNTSVVEVSKPDVVLVGIHVETPDQEMFDLFDQIDVQISNLTTWVRDSWIKNTPEYLKTQETMTFVRDKITIELHDNVTVRVDAHEENVSLCHTVQHRGPQEKAWARSIHVTEEVTLRIAADKPRSWDGFSPTLKAFRDLVTLATQSRAVLGRRRLLINIDRPTPYVIDCYVQHKGTV